MTPSPSRDESLVAAVRKFVETEVRPVAADLEHADRYPDGLVGRMRELGLFGALIPPAYGGLGLPVTTYARVIEELCRGWMSLAGVINSHTMLALIVAQHGTEEQRRRFLPRLASGEARGGLALTEPHAGSDVQAIRTVARRQGDDYLVTGTKMFVTNGREGNTFALLALTEPRAEPRHAGMSCFVVEKGHPALRVAKSIGKLGYKGVDTVELVFDELPVPAANLVGGSEGRGFKHVMSALETGRLNIAARAVGVAQAAFEQAIEHARGRAGRDAAPTALADMATRLASSRLLTRWAAGMKDRGERCDLEAGMAKLWASESAQAVALGALSLSGRAGTLATSPVERHYRDTPLMIIGEGTNEIQRLVIARNLIDRGARPRPPELGDERRELVLAVRQFVEKAIVPAVRDHEPRARYPREIVRELGALGVLGALVSQDHGGLGLDALTWAMLLEELSRGWSTVAAVVTAHSVTTAIVARFGTESQRARLLPAMVRGEVLGAGAFAETVTARRDRDDWVLTGGVSPVDAAAQAGLLILRAASEAGPACFLLAPGATGLTLGEPLPTLGARGLGVASLRLDGARVHPGSVLGGEPGRGDRHADTALRLTRLGVAAMAVGLAQAAFEAALRYAQERSAFGKPIAQHQAIQLKLADMATGLAAARLLTHHAAERFAEDEGAALSRLAKLLASETALEVTLEAMRIHGGYGYTTEFPVERYYRDAAALAPTPEPNDTERLEIARSLVERSQAAPVSGDADAGRSRAAHVSGHPDAERSQAAPASGHPRSEPSPGHPLQ